MPRQPTSALTRAASYEQLAVLVSPSLAELSQQLRPGRTWTQREEEFPSVPLSLIESPRDAAQSVRTPPTSLDWSLGFGSYWTSSASWLEGRVKSVSRSSRAIEKRIVELKGEANSENYAFSTASLETLRRFLNEAPILKPGRLVLMENGNLRATWSAEHDTHLGLQFLPTGGIQYVIFTRRPLASMISRTHGTDTVAGISQQLEAFGLYRLLAP